MFSSSIASISRLFGKSGRHYMASSVIMPASMFLLVIISAAASEQLDKYTYQRLAAFVDSMEQHPSPHKKSKVLGKSLLGKDIPLFTITDTSVSLDRKKIYWAQFRVHGGEDKESYIMEEMFRFLLDTNTAEVRDILKRNVFFILPVINPAFLKSVACAELRGLVYFLVLFLIAVLLRF